MNMEKWKTLAGQVKSVKTAGECLRWAWYLIKECDSWDLILIYEVNGWGWWVKCEVTNKFDQ